MCMLTWSRPGCLGRGDDPHVTGHLLGHVARVPVGDDQAGDECGTDVRRIVAVIRLNIVWTEMPNIQGD